MPNTLIPIQTVTVGAGGLSSIDFTNIPQNYTDLSIKFSVRATSSASARAEDTLVLALNNDTTGSNYTVRYLRGNGASAGSGVGSGFAGSYAGEFNGSTSTASTFTSGMVYLPNYAGATNKSFSIDIVQETNASTAYMQLHASLWANTSAVNRLTFSNYNSNTFAQGSTFTLYGISNGVKAVGGTLTVAGGYAYHTFTSTSAFLPNQIIRGAEVLLVAGGGGGSSANGSGAGGGAGGVISSITGTLNAGTSYLATVGAGGGGSDTNNSGNNGRTGNNSTFASAVVALGGGGGTATVDGNGYGLSGGSGGGVTPAPSGTRFGGLGTVGQGNNGGNPGPWGTNYGAGGGGGAGAAGSNGSAAASGNGGAGTSSYALWLSTTGTGVLAAGTHYIAGGGAGGARTTNTGGLGGIGGGAVGSSTSTGTAGTANTGGGGSGAGGTDGLAAGGAGGSGLVIVRYRLD
jgi:hypothetical protein